MIWGCSIFSVSGGDVGDDEDIGDEYNYRVAMNSPARTLQPMQQLSNPMGYSQHHDLAHVAVDHER